MRAAAALLLVMVACVAHAGSGYTPAASGGASYAPADPMQAGSSTTWTLSDWADAGSIGGATTVKRALLASGGIAIYPKTTAALGVASGARAQGALVSVAAGDFVHGFRIGVSTPSKAISASLGDTIEVGAAFVDGTDVGTSSWYGIVGDYSAGTAWYAESSLYSMSTTSGAGRWDSAVSYTALVSAVAPLNKTYDIWFQRSGTTLNAYVARPGQAPALAATWSVSAGAGLAGIRFQMWSESAANVYTVTCTLHTATTTAVLPWEA